MGVTRKKILCGAALPLVVASLGSYAAEINFNGFASVVAGVVVRDVALPDGGRSVYGADNGFLFEGDNDRAIYTDKVSYSPDTNYGLQVKSDLNDDLSLVAQITARGSTDYQAEVEWLYLSYAFTSNLTLQAGHQRTPLYFYSDFLDVGYSYHWVRPPNDVYQNHMPDYEGVSVNYVGSLGDWATKFRVYTGAIENEGSFFGLTGSEAVYGLSFNVGNDYLQFNFASLTGDFYSGGPDTGKDNPAAILYTSAAINLSLGGFFLFAEAVQNTFQNEDEFLSFFDGGELVSFRDRVGSLVSAGYAIGDFTPHLTFGQFYADIAGIGTGDSRAVVERFERSTVTAGIRWDFHPASAFKIEFSSTTDDSTSLLQSLRGKVDEADLLTMGFDVFF